MKVKDLIEKLQTFDPELVVYSTWYDCEAGSSVWAEVNFAFSQVIEYYHSKETKNEVFLSENEVHL